jgi:serine/threonine protein kinase
MTDILGDAAASGRPTYRIIGNLPGGGPTTRLVIAHHDGLDIECVQKTVYGHATGLAFTEPRLLDRLRGDDIVTVLDAQHHPTVAGAVIFVMPRYPEGSVLDALNGGHQFSLSEAVNITGDALTALAKVHDRLGGIHGDMKPGNVLLRSGRTRGALSDLGSAMPKDAMGTAPMVGPTWLYLPPEAFATNLVSVRSDIYSIGLTAFETLNGRFDYAALVPGAIARLGRGLRAIPDSALTWAPHVPKELRLIVQHAIAIDPAMRPASSHAMLKELRHLELIDWRRTLVGPGLIGGWEGTWPPQDPVHKRRAYRVEASLQKRSGRLRVTAQQRASAVGRWQTFGVPRVDIARDDARAMAKVFAAVAARVRQLVAAR